MVRGSTRGCGCKQGFLLGALDGTEMVEATQKVPANRLRFTKKARTGANVT